MSFCNLYYLFQWNISLVSCRCSNRMVFIFTAGFWEFLVRSVVWKYFLPLYSFSFHLKKVFYRTKDVILMKSNISISPFMDQVSGVKSMDFSSSPKSWRFSVILKVLQFHILLYDLFQVNFCIRCENKVEIIFLAFFCSQMPCCSSAIYWKGYFFPYWIIFAHLCKTILSCC